METVTGLLFSVVFFCTVYFLLKIAANAEKETLIREIEKKNPDYYFDKELKIHKVWAIGD